MTDFDKKTQRVVQALRESVAAALEKKRRLGQYAVIWDGKKVVRIPPSKIPEILSQKTTQKIR